MARKRDRKKGANAAKDGAAAVARGLKRRLRRLEEMLAVAAAKESRRVRKLEKAHLRRQRIEAKIETARLAASLAPAAPVKAPKALLVNSTGQRTPKVRAKAAPVRTPAKAPAKDTAAKAAPAKTLAGTVRAKAAPAKAPAKTPARAVRAKALARAPAATPPAPQSESPTEP